MAEEKTKTEFITKEQRAIAEGLVSYINASPSPYHAVQSAVQILEKANFKPLDETDTTQAWTNLAPGNYYFTRNQSSIIAFIKPKKFVAGNGFTILGAHTDSPCFRVKPISKKTKENYLMVGVEKYGGGLWHTWFDRDLSVAGRVMIKTKDGAQSKLVRIRDPILRIPNLAIHLVDRSDRSAFKFCTETNTVPIFATQAAAQLNNDTSEDTTCIIKEEHHALLLKLVAEELNCDVNQILDFELYLYDVQPSVIGGALKEFIFSARLDNLCSTYSTLTALLSSMNDSLDNEQNIRMIASFDNEEIGSNSNRGAASNLLYSTMKRIHGEKMFDAAMQKSILISCDMAHAIHPNYASKHESNHKPEMHQGLVIKYNCNQRYATTMVSTYHLIQCAKNNELPLQKFVVKNNMPCGSTIGPILSTRCGIRTVDVGCPQLSMHSIREQCGVKDVATSTALFTKFFESFVQLDATLKVD
eukprot:82661_1